MILDYRGHCRVKPENIHSIAAISGCWTGLGGKMRLGRNESLTYVNFSAAHRPELPSLEILRPSKQS